ncbi:MAG: hypothetical protein EOO03_06765 [Chitinophagaceae bacterium]|nr:MAG: hypothetical protein EOO03_06765 [Chitinophagaceae bacterium]
MSLSFKNIAPFISTGQNRNSRLLSYAGLAIGILLLLCSVQLYITINQLLKDRNPRTAGHDYIAITKKVTDASMGTDHSFLPNEIADLKKQPFVTDATPLLAAKFAVSASGNSLLPFTTDIFLEAINTDFIDTVPPSFVWQQGQTIVPIIVSADYLELYNTVFAPSRDLPQLSASSIGSLLVQLQCSGPNGTQIFSGKIVAQSDRINSVIVPINFLQWANQNIGNTSGAQPTRLFVKTTDANNPSFLQYLETNSLQVNKDKTKFGRVKQVLQAVVAGLGGFALLITVLALMLFSFYLQLMIVRSKDNLLLLLSLGYSPAWLTATVAKRWIPVYAGIILFSLAAAQLLLYFLQQHFLAGRADVSLWLHWSVLLVSGLLLLLCVFVNFRLIKRLLFKL